MDHDPASPPTDSDRSRPTRGSSKAPATPVAARGPKGRVPPVSTTRLWLEDAWDTWIRQALFVLSLVGLGVLYYFEFIPPAFFSGALSVVMVGTALILAARHATSLVQSHWELGMIWTLVGLTAVVSLSWVVGVLEPAQVAWEGRLGMGYPDVTIPELSARDVELTVAGHLKRAGDASYEIQVNTATGSSTVTGTMLLSDHPPAPGKIRRRVSRPSAPREVSSHRHILHLKSPPIGLHVLAVEEKLKRLEVSIRPIWLPSRALMGLSVVLAGASAMLDGVLTVRRGQTLLPIAVGATLLYGTYYFRSVSPERYLPTTVGAALLAAIVGTLGGMVLQLLGRKVAARLIRVEDAAVEGHSK